MNLTDMHIMFRQYAQQMGMQNVRAILPEQIDLVLNNSIYDVINRLIQEHLGMTNDRIISDSSKISQINAFKTLYEVKEIPLCPTAIEYGNNNDYIQWVIGSLKKGKITLKLECRKSDAIPVSESLDNKGYSLATNGVLFIVDFSIDYIATTTGYENSGSGYSEPTLNTDFITNLFPVRLIDDAFLADTLNDFILKNRLRSPIIVNHNNNKFDLYIDTFKPYVQDSEHTYYRLANNLLPYHLRVSYIRKPATVTYSEDVSETPNVDCDLPEYLHADIVRHAVELYQQALTGSIQSSLQSQQRNNAINSAQANTGEQTTPQQRQ